jgi:hypothetical protein
VVDTTGYQSEIEGHPCPCHAQPGATTAGFTAQSDHGGPETDSRGARSEQLFAYAQIEDEAQWASIANTPECRNWWKHMKELMPHNSDDSRLATDLREVFHLP